MLCRYLQYLARVVILSGLFLRFGICHRATGCIEIFTTNSLGKQRPLILILPGSQSQGLCTCYIKSLASCHGRLVLKDTGWMSHNYFGFWFDTYYRGWSIKHLVGLQSLLSYTISSKALPGSPCTTSVAVLDTEHHTPTKKKTVSSIGFRKQLIMLNFPKLKFTSMN